MTTRDNEQMIERARKRLRKRAKRGLRGYPVATAALYGPDDTRATKLTVGIAPARQPAAAQCTQNLRSSCGRNGMKPSGST